MTSSKQQLQSAVCTNSLKAKINNNNNNIY